MKSPSTNRPQNELDDFFEPSELQINRQEFQELVSIFQLLRKWKNESMNTPEVDTVEPEYSCEK